ncbi:MAG: YCF48-related protein, partial [Ignavibacteriaceae bacterium]|nr:YCF48-related protein [Ignavibacteriaceae bacterium]
MKKMYLALLLLSMQSFIFAQPWEWQWQNAKPVGNALYDVHALSSTRIIAFGTGSTVLISTDAGETWQVSYPDASRREIWGSYFLNSTTGFMVGGTTAIGSLLMKTTDGGNTWVAKTPGTTNILYDIEFYDANNGIACGAAGTVIRTTDGGDTWTAIASLGAGTIYKVSIVNSAVVYIGCSNMAGYLFKSTNFGATFSNVTPAQITSSVYGMYVGSASNIWATTSSNGIVATTDGGTTWTVQQVDANTVYDIKFYNSTNGFAVDSKGIIWTTTNSGTNWAQTQLGTINPLRQMDISTSNLILVGDGGAIFKSTTSGSSWAAKFTTAAQQQFRKIIFKGDNNGWAGECPTSGNSKLIYTTDGGQNWATRYTFPNPIYSMSMPTNTTWYIGSASNTIYKTTDGGDSFTTLTQPLTGETFWFIGFADSLNGYAGGSAGKIIKTTDGGSSWTDLSTAAGFTTNQIYEIAVIDAQTIYLSGGGARLAKTTNGGTSFTAQSTGLAGTFFTVKFKDATTGFVGSANLGVSKTTNSGASWTVETLPTNPPASNASIWGFAFSGSTVWASTVNGDILYSTDSGTTWTVAKRPSSQVTYNFAVSNNNLWGAGGQGNIIKGYANPNTVSLNLTALIEALYVAGGTSMPITPDVTVELHSATSPYTLVESKTGTLST